MKTTLAIIASLVVVVLGAVLVVPTFIDWNEYKGEIVSRAYDATGRNLEIRGDIKISLLPAPALKVNDVRVANVEGAASADMAALKSLEVRVALMPLLGGNIQVESVRLVEPVIDIQRFADGRTNLVFTPRGSGRDAAPQARADERARPADPGVSGGPAIAVDDFVIENGTVTFRDDAAGRVERIENLNGRFAAASMAGPVESSGSLVARGIPLSYKVAVGAIVNNRTAPFSAEFDLTPGEVKAQLSGTLAGIGEAPRFKGKVNVVGSNLRRIAAAAGAALPEPLARPFGIAANINASAARVEVSDLRLNVGEVRGDGTVAVTMGDMVQADVDININRVDVAALLSAPTAKPASPAASTGNSVSAPLAPVDKDGSVAGGMEIPKNVAAQINLGVGAISYRDGLVQNAKLDVAINAGEITVNQISAQLPGASDVALFGFVTLPEGKPQFDGNMDFSTNDLRAVLKWLGVESPPAAPDRLRKLAFAGKVAANQHQIRLSEIDIGLDNTRVRGAVTVALRERPAFGANLIVDKINLDAYLPEAAARGRGAAPNARPVARPDSKSEATETGKAADAAKSDANGNANPNPLAALAALGGVDANFKAKVGSLTYAGVPANDIQMDAVLFDGALTFKDFRVADAVGVSAKINGGISGLKGSAATADPRFAGLIVDVRAKDVTRLAKLIDVSLPISPADLGEVSVAGTMDGAPSDLAVDLTIGAARGKYGIAGRLRPMSPAEAVDADIHIQHPDVQRLLNIAGVGYAPAGKLGRLDVTGRITGGLLSWTLAGIQGTVADVALAGDVKAALSGPRPQFNINLETGAVAVDRFLPAQRKAGLAPAAPRIQKADLRLPTGVTPAEYLAARFRRAATGADRWSRDAIDLGALNAVDAETTIKSAAVSHGKYRLDNAFLTASLKNGVLTANRLTGQLFGGALSAGGRVASTGQTNQYELQATVNDVDLGQAMSALSSSAVRSGKMTFAADLGTSGASMFDMVSRLSGQGKLAMKDVDPGASSKDGSVLGAVTGLLQPLNALGGRQAPGVADITGSFRVEEGVARFDDLKIESGVGSGGAKGTIDLPNWQIDSAGEIRLDRNMLVALLSQRANLPQVLPFSVKGRLDSPNVKLDTGKMEGGGLPVPGLDKLREKKGVGEVLDQFLPGISGAAPKQQPQPTPPQPSSEPPPQEPTPQQPAQQPQQQQEKPAVDQLLKGILQGIGR